MILFFLFYCFSWYFLKNTLNPVHQVIEGMEEVQKGNLETQIVPAGQSEIRKMVHSFNRMVRILKTSLEETRKAEEMKHNAEIRALQSQINPHFIVNSLNSIRFMAQVSKFDGIRKMAEALIRIVSCSFRRNISFYTLREEIEVLDSYLYLMKIRYSDGFETEYQIASECLNCLVPRLILQPLVENSVVHGFNGEDMGLLKISAELEDGKLVLGVWDNGRGMTEKEMQEIYRGKERSRDDNSSIGLENVISRLRLNYGDACEIRMESELGQYTRITLKLPKEEKKKMRKVLIVDDEAIVRVTLRSMIRWEDYGMEVAADCNSGFQALNYLQNHAVDLLITDVKMPEMSGIELLRRAGEMGKRPVSLVLSGYNEFELVREAFRLGASDYLLKGDLTEENLSRTLKTLGEKYWNLSMEETTKGGENPKEKKISFPKQGTYGVAVFQVDDLFGQMARFGENLKDMLEVPMLEVVRQIPRVNKRAQLLPVHPGYCILLYAVTDFAMYRWDVLSVIRQMQAVWKDYMNLTVSAAVCDPLQAPDIEEAAAYCEHLLLLSPLGGKSSVTTCWESERLMKGMEDAEKRYERLLSYLYDVDELQFEREKQKYLSYLECLDKEDARLEILRMIALLARKFREYEEDFFPSFRRK